MDLCNFPDKLHGFGPMTLFSAAGLKGNLFVLALHSVLLEQANRSINKHWKHTSICKIVFAIFPCLVLRESISPPEIMLYFFCGGGRRSKLEASQSWASGNGPRFPCRTWAQRETRGGAIYKHQTMGARGGELGARKTRSSELLEPTGLVFPFDRRVKNPGSK